MNIDDAVKTLNDGSFYWAIRTVLDEAERLRADARTASRWYKEWQDSDTRIEAALALHKPYEMNHQRYCDLCDGGGIQWPCPTVKALRGEQ
jgi:hypothetical protein